MSGHRSFDELRARMAPGRRAKIAEATQELLRELNLQELRQARQRSQESLARELKVGQPAVAKLERRADMYVSNLRRFVEALGGALEITARFPDGVIPIGSFGDLVGADDATGRPQGKKRSPTRTKGPGAVRRPLSRKASAPG